VANLAHRVQKQLANDTSRRRQLNLLHLLNTLRLQELNELEKAQESSSSNNRQKLPQRLRDLDERLRRLAGAERNTKGVPASHGGS